MKKLMFLLENYRHNYILYLKGLGYNEVRLLTHKGDVSKPCKAGPSESLIQRKGGIK